MAGTTGLEPATSAVTGQRSNQLSYVPTESGDSTQWIVGASPILWHTTNSSTIRGLGIAVNSDYGSSGNEAQEDVG